MWFEGELARSTGGYEGAARALELYRQEISGVMALRGCNSIPGLGPHYLHPARIAKTG